MPETHIDIPAERRTKLVELLNRRLADAIDLRLQTKQAHWNVRGENFAGLHKLFDDLADEISDYVDEIAERALQLGGLAHGTIETVQKRSTLTPYPEHVTASQEHVRLMTTAFATFAANIRKAIDQADELGDKITADLFTEVGRGIDKGLWMIEAHRPASE